MFIDLVLASRYLSTASFPAPAVIIGEAEIKS